MGLVSSSLGTCILGKVHRVEWRVAASGEALWEWKGKAKAAKYLI